MRDINELTAKLKAVPRHSVDGYGRQDICYNEPEGEFVFYSDYEALVEALEATEKRVAELEEIATDYGMKFQRAQDDLKKMALMHRDEARTLPGKLPKPHAHLIWIQAGHAPDDYWDDVAVSHSESDRCCDGSERYPVYARWEIEEILAAAGIKLQIEGE